MNKPIQILTGGSGQDWSGNKLLKATLAKVRGEVDSLLMVDCIPVRLKRGWVDEYGEPMMLIGTAGCYTLTWREATIEEYHAFDYDLWLVEQFLAIHKADDNV